MSSRAQVAHGYKTISAGSLWRSSSLLPSSSSGLALASGAGATSRRRNGRWALGSTQLTLPGVPVPRLPIIIALQLRACSCLLTTGRRRGPTSRWRRATPARRRRRRTARYRTNQKSGCRGRTYDEQLGRPWIILSGRSNGRWEQRNEYFDTCAKQ